ncbi:EF-hand domain-containing protein [Pararhodobacter zhoushanensis]|uniref:EF-hand domain-containing protein n=1 Tax=Pararhodobacter zhoushanensis TaxID=2479545 RepID=UPI000F8EFB9B|nr:EF-hand domain-containing protein [Pararhodobacter zhoushanensis]
MNTKTLTAIALLIAAVPAASFAQSGPMAGMTPPTLDFAAADADGSGGISAEEWTAYSATLHSEMRAQRTATRVDALIAAADADGDGALTRDELITGMTAMGDTRRESRGGMRGGHGERHGMRGDHGGWGGHHMRGDDDHGRRGEMRDGQRGGQRGEMRGERGGDMASRSFARMDRNDDGSIDATELGQAQEFLNWMAQRPRFN